MLYPSALVTAKALSKPGGNPPIEGDLVSNYTKHYYVGSQRISSTLGTMKDLGLYPAINPAYFSTIRDSANQSVLDAFNGLSNTYTQLEQGGNFNTPNSGGQEGTLTKRYVHNSEKYDAYWYHSDHLGSSSYITNTNGIVSQHIEYMPFGETLVDEHQNSYNSPFKFNAKELDDETGNYYYGARYYDPKWSVWLSVDPLAEQMPSWSSYNYTFNNPIRYTDPTGMAPQDIIIQYKDKFNKVRFFRLKSDNMAEAISKADKSGSTFLINTVNAIFYNDSNCGAGVNIQKAINSNKKYYLIENVEGNGSSAYEGNGNQPIVQWDDTGGLEVENGDVLSPATVLEHEFSHIVDLTTNRKAHNKALKDTSDPNYSNAEEKRVIQGSETDTARANGEISATKSQSRYHHKVDSGVSKVKVENSTSTRITRRYD